MSDKAYCSELERALARPDLTDLQRQLATYKQYQGADWPDDANDDMTAIMTAHWNDPDRGLAYVVLAAAHYDERPFLFFIAAGPLEDLLHDPSEEMLGRIVAEARKSPRFRWMLAGVWLHAISEHAREPIRRAIGGWTENMETPIPAHCLNQTSSTSRP